MATTRKQKRAGERRKLSDQIRDAVEASGQTRYAICVATGIDHGAFSHFMARHRGLSLETLDRLVDHLQLVLVREDAKGR